jgi:hypothetical protein
VPSRVKYVVPALRASRLRQQYRNETPQHHHCDSPTSLVGCSPHVLSHEYRCGCAKFGTKGPQGKSCHPDQYRRRSQAVSANQEAASVLPE